MNSILISNAEIRTLGVNIMHSNPKLLYAYLVQDVYNRLCTESTKGRLTNINNTAQISPSAVICEGAIIGANVKIGPNSVVHSGVKLHDNVTVGSGTVIGGQGFGGVRWNKRILMLPHIGGVVIEKNVNIGSNCTIDSGTFEPTIVGAESKLDNCVHIAHNCIIGKAVFITAGVKLSGSVNVGSSSWLGTGSIIKQKIIVGEGVTTGIGSVVFRDIPDGMTVAGNPAVDLKTLVRRGMRK